MLFSRLVPSFKLGFVKSDVGSFDPTIFSTSISVISSRIVVPYANRMLQKGVDLPVTGFMTFRNTRLELLQGSLLFATDLTYNGLTREQRDAEFIEERLDEFEEAEKLDEFEQEAEQIYEFEESEEEAEQLDEFYGEAERLDELEAESFQDDLSVMSTSDQHE